MVLERLELALGGGVVVTRTRPAVDRKTPRDAMGCRCPLLCLSLQSFCHKLRRARQRHWALDNELQWTLNVTF